jgi:hypothetical protein
MRVSAYRSGLNRRRWVRTLAGIEALKWRVGADALFGRRSRSPGRAAPRQPARSGDAESVRR